MVTELPEQVLVGLLPHALVFDEPADRLQDQAGHGLGHQAVPVGRNRLSGYIVPSDAGRGRFFFKGTHHSAGRRRKGTQLLCRKAAGPAGSAEPGGPEADERRAERANRHLEEFTVNSAR
jgi:hypothetical protein